MLFQEIQIICLRKVCSHSKDSFVGIAQWTHEKNFNMLNFHRNIYIKNNFRDGFSHAVVRESWIIYWILFATESLFIF